MSVPDNREHLVDDYMQRVKRIAPQYNLPDYSTNFLTKAIEMLQEHMITMLEGPWQQ